MSFLLTAAERPGSGVERTIREQMKKLEAECGEALEAPAVFAHKARVRAKKIRAALRLAQPLIGKKVYRAENRWWRDAARALATLRDADARLEALEALRPFLTARIGSAMMLRLTARFERQRKEADAAAAIDAFRALIEAGHPAPEIPRGERGDVVEALKETYRLARRSMKEALADPTPEKLHEWRKQTKYHALQARLMRSIFPDTLTARATAARDLSDKLGEAQDIEIVLAGAKGWRDAPAGFFDVLRTRRGVLVAEAEREGAVLFFEKPKAWTRGLTASPPPVEPTTRAEPAAPVAPAPALDHTEAEADL